MRQTFVVTGLRKDAEVFVENFARAKVFVDNFARLDEYFQRAHAQNLLMRMKSCSTASYSGRDLVNPHRAGPVRPLHHPGRGSMRQAIVAAADRNFYQILQVDRGADLKTIKKAYKKKALQYHPDVNKEPDAKDLFMECKTAYQTLADSEQRREYDRALNGGSVGSDWGSFGDAFKGASSGSYQRQRKPRQEEDFYGFEDFFKDLESNLSKGVTQLQSLFRDLEKDFQQRQAQQTGQPKSLWQELYDVGEEFVEFLEQEVASVKKQARGGGADGGRAAASVSSDADRASVAAQQEADRAKESAEEAKAKAEQDIDDMLADLKRKLDK